MHTHRHTHLPCQQITDYDNTSIAVACPDHTLTLVIINYKAVCMQNLCRAQPHN